LQHQISVECSKGMPAEQFDYSKAVPVEQLVKPLAAAAEFMLRHAVIPMRG
jgi:hypothetical protein